MVDCNNCPEPEEQSLEGNIILTYFTKKTLVLLLKRALPNATVHDDCSIEIDLPCIDGFKQDSDNPRLFHLEWPDCQCRMINIKYPMITGICLLNDKQLTIEDCKNCDKRI